MMNELLLGMGVGTLAYLVLRPRKSSGLEGLGTAKSRTGIMGSPFFVECTYDQSAYEETLRVFRNSKNAEMYATDAAMDCEWGCVDGSEVQVARFRNRQYPNEYAFLNRSPKPGGGWQITWMDDRGPRGDIRRETQCELVKQLSSGFKYYGDAMMVDGQVMSDWYLEEWL